MRRFVTREMHVSETHVLSWTQVVQTAIREQPCLCSGVIVFCVRIADASGSPVVGWDAQRRYLRQLSDGRPFLQRQGQVVWRGRTDGGARDLWRCGMRQVQGLTWQLAVHLDAGGAS